MICRQCGTEIADKALICYRCGTATTEAKYKPVDLKSRSRTIPLLFLVLSLLLVIVGVYEAISGETTAARTLGGALAAAGVLVAALRLIRRR
jgi:hypothetical protein